MRRLDLLANAELAAALQACRPIRADGLLDGSSAPASAALLAELQPRMPTRVTV